MALATFETKEKRWYRKNKLPQRLPDERTIFAPYARCVPHAVGGKKIVPAISHPRRRGSGRSEEEGKEVKKREVLMTTFCNAEVILRAQTDFLIARVRKAGEEEVKDLQAAETPR